MLISVWNNVLVMHIISDPKLNKIDYNKEHIRKERHLVEQSQRVLPWSFLLQEMAKLDLRLEGDIDPGGSYKFTWPLRPNNGASLGKYLQRKANPR